MAVENAQATALSSTRAAESTKDNGLMINGTAMATKNSETKMFTMVRTNSANPTAKVFTHGPMVRYTTANGRTVKKMAMGSGAVQVATPTLASGSRGKHQATVSISGKTKTSMRASGTRTSGMAMEVTFSTMVTNSLDSMSQVSLKALASTNGLTEARTWAILRME